MTAAILVLMSATHFAYFPLAELRGLPVLAPALALALFLGGAYAVLAWLARTGDAFSAAANVVVGEDLGVLAAELILGSPWADTLRPGAALLLILQLALAFAEMVRRGAGGRPLAPAARLAGFVVVYAVVLAGLAVLEPAGLLEAVGWPPG